MQRKKYENPLIVEELVFQIAPELLDRYLEGDFTCFTQGLEKWPGFMEAVDPNWVAEADARLGALMGEGNIKLLEVAHAANQMTLVQEYR